MIRDIKPSSPYKRLSFDYTEEELAKPIELETACTVVGMNKNFAVQALGYRSGSRPRTISLAQVLDLLDVDGYQETFLPRSLVPGYLLGLSKRDQSSTAARTRLVVPDDVARPLLEIGDVRRLAGELPTESVQCLVTSSPYWGMRLYDDVRDVSWLDGEKCPYGFEQTPEGFIRHTTEILYLLKPLIASTGSVWWNLMDTYNTRTPIRGSSRDKLRAMNGDPEHVRGWTEHEACRHSAGHIYLTDGELASIPLRVAERASRIGYTLKSFITWNKASTPEPVRSRVTRQAEYIIHLSVNRTPYFDRSAWQGLDRRLGGSNPPHESPEKLTDVWSIPSATGSNGHGAEFPISVPARCIALTSKAGDLVLDPFVGSGTSALAAMELRRRFVGFDISKKYVDIARRRVQDRADKLSSRPDQDGLADDPRSVNGHAHKDGAQLFEIV